jgi:dsDNA-binding SOS-regulon protein
MTKGQKTGDRWIKMRDISDTVEEWLIRWHRQK